ncbi:Repressor ROX1 [Psilocybe cubensis]|uniref:Repressor ROX1 n=2 Tax=Psilocybe cubensis TaxID=181762 RepID=A0ACB8GFK0_PSICU|nr:Repressor ROX1 [Psilocybe cubensis]KAH9474411.1 Repressor ROX1 [Psilocybe cubensis]
MPAERRKKSTKQQETGIDQDATRLTTQQESRVELSHSPVSPVTEDSLSSPLSDSIAFKFEQDVSEPRRTFHGRKKPVDHIPRPPNAFILFRSMFIKSRHVSTGVETNHSTLSKIIGLTWQNLPEEERQKWHIKAKHAQDEHKRQFPQYSFKPVHTKAKNGERKKIREVGPKDQKRCQKIAELLVSGTKGEALEAAIHEFDKTHVPEIITRFDTPITANSFSPTSVSPAERQPSPAVSLKRKVTPNILDRTKSSPPRPSITIPSSPKEEPHEASPAIPFYENSLFTNPQPSFDYDTFTFSTSHSTPTIYHGEAYTQDVRPADPSFDSPVTQDPSMLFPPAEYRGGEEWTRQSSPLSNATGSMPSTPSHLSIPFPEPYSTFTPEAASDYASIHTPFPDYSNYSYAAMSEPVYEIKDSRTSSSGFHAFSSEAVQQAPTMLRDDVDFSTLMHSLTSYSL